MLSLLRLECKPKNFKSISKTIPDSSPKWTKCIPVFRPKRRKNSSRWGCTYLYSLHKGVPPPPRAKQTASNNKPIKSVAECVSVWVFFFLQSNLSTTVTFGTEGSGRCGEVAVVERFKQDTDNVQCMDCPPKTVAVSEVRLSLKIQATNYLLKSIT